MPRTGPRCGHPGPTSGGQGGLGFKDWRLGSRVSGLRVLGFRGKGLAFRGFGCRSLSLVVGISPLKFKGMIRGVIWPGCSRIQEFLSS